MEPIDRDPASPAPMLDYRKGERDPARTLARGYQIASGLCLVFPVIGLLTQSTLTSYVGMCTPVFGTFFGLSACSLTKFSLGSMLVTALNALTTILLLCFFFSRLLA